MSEESAEDTSPTVHDDTWIHVISTANNAVAIEEIKEELTRHHQRIKALEEKRHIFNRDDYKRLERWKDREVRRRLCSTLKCHPEEIKPKLREMETAVRHALDIISDYLDELQLERESKSDE